MLQAYQRPEFLLKLRHSILGCVVGLAQFFELCANGVGLQQGLSCLGVIERGAFRPDISSANLQAAFSRADPS